MRSVLCLTASVLALLAAGCGNESKPSPNVTNAAPAPAGADATRLAAPATADAGLVVTGPIIVEHQIEMTAQRDGIVEKIFADAPGRVKAGTLLAELDGRQIAANLEAARAKTRSVAADLKNWQAESEVLKADYTRQQHLFELGLTSEEQLQHAKYKAESDQWDILRVKEMLNTTKEEEHSLELEMEKTKIIAPFDGLIARRYVREGQNVARGDRLFWVTAESPLLMRFTLPEKYFGTIRNGQQLEITSADVPGEKHAARIKQISPVVDPSSGTFEVLAELMGNRGAFRPGMNASAQLGNPH
jgi:membrane fusion protein (multidrug efflux system)